MSNVIFNHEDSAWLRGAVQGVHDAIRNGDTEACQHVTAQANGAVLYTTLLLRPVALACPQCAPQPGALSPVKEGFSYVAEYCDRCASETDVNVYFSNWLVPSGHRLKIAVQLCDACAALEHLPLCDKEEQR